MRESTKVHACVSSKDWSVLPRKHPTKRFKTMDVLGIEPRAFCMRSRRDTTTPYAQDAKFKLKRGWKFLNAVPFYFRISSIVDL